MMNGIIIVDKEQNFTSADVVAKMRGICKQKKIGHTGTLDPNATGVLPVCLGNATKLCDMLTDKQKEYVAEFELGKNTDTQDIWGEVVSDSGDMWKKLTKDNITEAIFSFLGTYMQIPPMYSAKKIQGKRLYELAREGKEVERKACEVSISELEILSMELPKITIRVLCSKGTYIRTLVYDIGRTLGCGAVMTALRRTKVSPFTSDRALTLSQLQNLRDTDRLEEALIPVETFFMQYPAVKVRPQIHKMLLNGNTIPLLQTDQIENTADLQAAKNQIENGQAVRVYGIDDKFYGVFLLQEETKLLKPWKMFFPE